MQWNLYDLTSVFLCSSFFEGIHLGMECVSKISHLIFLTCILHGIDGRRLVIAKWIFEFYWYRSVFMWTNQSTRTHNWLENWINRRVSFHNSRINIISHWNYPLALLNGKFNNQLKLSSQYRKMVDWKIHKWINHCRREREKEKGRSSVRCQTNITLKMRSTAIALTVWYNQNRFVPKALIVWKIGFIINFSCVCENAWLRLVECSSTELLWNTDITVYNFGDLIMRVLRSVHTNKWIWKKKKEKRHSL